MINKMKQKSFFHVFALLIALAVLIAIIGIGSTLVYFNIARFQRLSPVFDFVIGAVLFGFVAFCATYVIWLSRTVSKITKGIKDISLRKYQPLKESGIFSEIYDALNKMDMDIRDSDKLRNETESVRREWITNITHDLKTPLSPIKGYAELLTDNLILFLTPYRSTLPQFGSYISYQFGGWAFDALTMRMVVYGLMAMFAIPFARLGFKKHQVTG